MRKRVNGTFDNAGLWCAKVAPKIVHQGDCHVFTGKKAGLGYGQVWNKGTGHVYVHRLALSLKLGRGLTREEFACHKCDNPACCNSEHIFLGTPADNTADMMRKGRWVNIYERGFVAARGEKHSMAKLTEKQVAALRAEYAAGGITKKQLAIKYNICRQHAGHLINHGWKHAA